MCVCTDKVRFPCAHVLLSSIPQAAPSLAGEHSAIMAARACQAVAEVLAALKVVALEARVLDIPAKQAIT